MRPFGAGHEGIDGLQGAGGQFKLIGQHDNGYLRPDLLDLVRDCGAIQEAEVVLEHNGIHRPGHEKTQTLVTVGCCYQFVSVLLKEP